MGSVSTEKSEKKPGSGTVKWIDIVARGCHIAVMSPLFGGVFWGIPFPRLILWHHLTVATGVFLILIALYKSRHWFYQGNGVMVELHVGLLALIHFQKDLAVPILTAVLFVGVVGSHMSGKLRHWSFRHGRRID